MRPSWRDRQYRELKKLFFLPPSKCPIDLFGLIQQQLGSESREGCAYIRVDAPKQVLALQRVLVRAKMPDAVRGAWVDDEFRRRRPPAGFTHANKILTQSRNLRVVAPIPWRLDAAMHAKQASAIVSRAWRKNFLRAMATRRICFAARWR